MADTPSHWLAPVNPYIAVGSDTNGKYSLLHVTTQPRGGPPIHKHANEDEGFLVLKGIYRFWVGDEETAQPVDVFPGGHVFGPRNEFHRFENIGEEDGEMLIVFTPAGFEDYFKEMQAVREVGGDDLIDKERAIDRKYGLTIERGK